MSLVSGWSYIYDVYQTMYIKREEWPKSLAAPPTPTVHTKADVSIKSGAIGAIFKIHPNTSL